MRITANDSQELVLEDFPAFFAGVVAVVFAASVYVLASDWAAMTLLERTALGLWCALMPLALDFVAPRTRLRLDRTAGRVELVRRGLIRRARETLPLHLLKKARVQAFWGEDSRTYRLLLEFDAALPAHLDPGIRRRRERRLRYGFRLAKIHEMPITSFYPSDAQPRNAADAINRWL